MLNPVKNSTECVSFPSRSFDYIPFIRGSSEEHCESYTLTQFPPTLQKKVTLLQYFRDYMRENAGANPTSASSAPSTSNESSIPAVYVKKWLRTKHGMVFRLSNKNVQVLCVQYTRNIQSKSSPTLIRYLILSHGKMN